MIVHEVVNMITENNFQYSYQFFVLVLDKHSSLQLGQVPYFSNIFSKNQVNLCPSTLEIDEGFVLPGGLGLYDFPQVGNILILQDYVNNCCVFHINVDAVI